ncbi:MAG: helix-turn-helix transcriptional regulator [Peptococcaceae bacterium]|nr:helix-turn-helix transcriptional regulator [Peptococcaceae bacterium]
MTEHPPLSPEEAAEILKISKYTLYALIKRGEIPSRRIGRKIRIDYDSLMAYLQGDPNKKHSSENIEVHPNIPSKNFLRFVGSNDFTIELLSQFLSYSASNFELEVYFKGSMEGLIALYHREAGITGIHLWDEESKEYNLPFINRLLPYEDLTVINLAQRVQGFIFDSENPLSINSWEDITKKEIRLINRQKGSGTRLRLDQYLFEHGIPSNQIQGYNNEENTHLGVALKIANGEANIGIGVQAAAQRMGLGFVPLFKERFDLVILRETTSRPEWQKILSILNSTTFHKAIEQQKGYDASLTGQIIFETANINVHTRKK